MWLNFACFDEMKHVGWFAKGNVIYKNISEYVLIFKESFPLLFSNIKYEPLNW